MHEAVSMKPAEPKSTLLALKTASHHGMAITRWLRSAFMRLFKRYSAGFSAHNGTHGQTHHIVLKRRIRNGSLQQQLGLRVAPIIPSQRLGLRRPRNKSSPSR